MMRTPRSAAPHTRLSRSGASLIEVLVACLILAIVAIATAACLYQSRAQASIQRNRRTAMEFANARLEALRNAPYTVIQPPTQTYTAYYLDDITGSWRVSASDQGETVTLSGRSLPMTTTVQYMDADGGAASYDCLRITVHVWYRDGANDVVRLQTIRSP